MASFVGTHKEFRRYIGPRLRNLVQQFTRNHKAEVSACEHCGSKKNLESAHVHGRDRKEIIDIVLKDFTHNGIVTIDIVRFEERFKEEHLPFEKSILILCRECHRHYDSLNRNTTTEQKAVPEDSSKSSFIRVQRDYLPITLEPSDPDAFKQELLITKRAVIETTYTNGEVKQKPWSAEHFSSASNVFRNLRSRPEYRSWNWQSRGIVKVHVKVEKNA